MLNLPVNAPAKDYYAAFERLVVEKLRFASDAELFSRLVLDKQFIGGMPYLEAVKAAAEENPLLAADAEVTALIEQAALASDGQADSALPKTPDDQAFVDAINKLEANLQRIIKRAKNPNVRECVAEALKQVERTKELSGLFDGNAANLSNEQNP